MLLPQCRELTSTVTAPSTCRIWFCLLTTFGVASASAAKSVNQSGLSPAATNASPSSQSGAGGRQPLTPGPKE